jgi:hypothetical protein
VLIVRWVDRLGRNYEDVCDTIREFMRRGVVKRFPGYQQRCRSLKNQRVPYSTNGPPLGPIVWLRVRWVPSIVAGARGSPMSAVYGPISLISRSMERASVTRLYWDDHGGR